MGFKPTFNAETGRVKVLVRLSYCAVTKKTKSVNQEGAKLKHRTNGLIYKNTKDGKASKAVLDQAVEHVMDSVPKWKGKHEKILKAMDDKRLPVFDGDEYTNAEGDVRDHYEDTWYLKLTNDKLPKFKDRRGDDLSLEEAEELFLSGHWAVAYLHFYPVTDQDKGGNGVFATLDALQFFKRDEQFSGGGIDDDEIDDLGDDDDDGDDLNDKPAKKKAASIDDDDDI